MPKWAFNHTSGAFTAEEKRQLSQGMTRIYTTFGLPAFYCHTHFFELPAEAVYTGGEIAPPSTTISIYHAAHTFKSKEESEPFLKAFDDVIRPILKPKGINWESAIYETSYDYWRIEGLIPPAMGSDQLKKWVAANKITNEEALLRKQGYL
ncbi:putative oxalocrotonate tautomerase [Annulohypoxylon moriforme]|nr:putative oxalocrotonate tautomerase [Annulohypoxylon moriforme]